MTSTLNRVSVDIRALRRGAGLSQQRLAEIAGCSLSSVQQFERGYRPDGHSAVFDRIVNVLNDEAPGGNPDASQIAVQAAKNAPQE